MTETQSRMLCLRSQARGVSHKCSQMVSFKAAMFATSIGPDETGTTLLRHLTVGASVRVAIKG